MTLALARVFIIDFLYQIWYNCYINWGLYEVK